MKNLILAALLLTSTASIADVSKATMEFPCAPHKEVARMIGDKYGEVPSIVGIYEEDKVVTIWINSKKRTSTVTMTINSELTCLLVGMDNFQPVKPRQQQ